MPTTHPRHSRPLVRRAGRLLGRPLSRLLVRPGAARVPVIAAVTVFLFAVVTSHLVLWTAVRALDREAERLGQVYLDGLTAAVLPGLQAGDLGAVRSALERALVFQDGIPERRLAVATTAGAPLASAGMAGEAARPAPFDRGELGEAWEVSEDGHAVWAQRRLHDGAAAVAIVAAELDISALALQRAGLDRSLPLLVLVLAGLGAALAALTAAWVLRPVLTVAAALERVGTGGAAPLPADAVPVAGTSAPRLLAAFNGMLARMRERERLAGHLAARERAVLLGRLAATLAHEMRNPLAGMLTAVETARRFGADPVEREEALQVLERGLAQLETVVASTLAVHRDDGPPRPLTAADLDDLRTLAEPAARQHRVALDWHVALPRPFPTEASRLRQAVLNLLLNAVAATPAGGLVALEARVAPDGDLVVAVADGGPGLPPEAARRLLEGGGAASSPAEFPPTGGLGLDIVRLLVERLHGRLLLERPAAGGTRLTLRVPPTPDAGPGLPPEGAQGAPPQARVPA